MMTIQPMSSLEQIYHDDRKQMMIKFPSLQLMHYLEWRNKVQLAKGNFNYYVDDCATTVVQEVKKLFAKKFFSRLRDPSMFSPIVITVPRGIWDHADVSISAKGESVNLSQKCFTVILDERTSRRYDLLTSTVLFKKDNAKDILPVLLTDADVVIVHQGDLCEQLPERSIFYKGSFRIDVNGGKL